MSELSRVVAMSVETQFLDAAREVAPRYTGAFAHGLKSRTIPGPSGHRVEIISTTENPKPIWLRNGTRPHQIFPVRAKALRFATAGGVVFSRVVNHPGTKPSSMFAQLRLRAQRQLRETMLQSGKDYLRDLLRHAS